MGDSRNSWRLHISLSPACLTVTVTARVGWRFSVCAGMIKAGPLWLLEPVWCTGWGKDIETTFSVRILNTSDRVGKKFHFYFKKCHLSRRNLCRFGPGAVHPPGWPHLEPHGICWAWLRWEHGLSWRQSMRLHRGSWTRNEGQSDHDRRKGGASDIHMASKEMQHLRGFP